MKDGKAAKCIGFTLILLYLLGRDFSLLFQTLSRLELLMIANLQSKTYSLICRAYDKGKNFEKIFCRMKKRN